MACHECYSENPRITPLKEAGKCLESHRQYRCSTCGRIICIDVKGEKRARCFMPFQSREIAILYLKCAEIISGKLCGIYELTYKRGDKRYRIFQSDEDLQVFLQSNKEVSCQTGKPVYISQEYQQIDPAQIKYLSSAEISLYLQERKALGIID